MDLIMAQMQPNGQLIKPYHIIYVTNTCIMSWRRFQTLINKTLPFFVIHMIQFYKSLALIESVGWWLWIGCGVCDVPWRCPPSLWGEEQCRGSGCSDTPGVPGAGNSSPHSGRWHGQSWKFPWCWRCCPVMSPPPGTMTLYPAGHFICL